MVFDSNMIDRALETGFVRTVPLSGLLCFETSGDVR
jgi:hypothetical protein